MFGLYATLLWILKMYTLHTHFICSHFLNSIGIMQGYSTQALFLVVHFSHNKGQQLECLWHFENVLWLHLLMLWNLVKPMLDYMAVSGQHKLVGSKRTHIACSLYTLHLHNHDCRINCHWFTHKIATGFSTNWIIAISKMKKKKRRRRKDILYFVSPTFSKYLISYSRMIPLGRSGSCQDKEMLFFAIFPFFTLVIGEGAAK